MSISAEVLQPSVDKLSTKKDASYIMVNGVQLHYVCKGCGPHALLCIPPGLGTIEDYQPQLDHFGREGSGFKVVCFDPRGFGKSCHLDRPHNISAYTMDAKDGYELMQTLSLSEFSVMGWCSGGTAGLFLAAMFPQSVKNLIVIGTRSYITKDELAYLETERDIADWPIEIREWRMSVYGSSLQKVWSGCLDTLCYCHTNNNGDICTKNLSKISCPTLIVHGARDNRCQPFHGEYLRDHVIGSRLEVMEQGKHMLHIRHSQEFNKLVSDFLN